jgi:hypothetical protein
MGHSEVYQLAEQYVAVYRDILLIDPLCRLNLLVVDDGPACLIVKDQNSKMTWTAKLNSALNSNKEDIRLSVLEFLSDIIMVDFDSISDPVVKSFTEKAKCRIFNIFQSILPDLPTEGEEEDNEV